MSTGGEALPVLVVDGANFSDLDGFAREFSGLLCHGNGNRNLDAFNDILWVFRWLNSELSREAFGHDATVRWLEQILLTCHPPNRASIKARTGDAQRGSGPTPYQSADGVRNCR